jgi:hypothetical protein
MYIAVDPSGDQDSKRVCKELERRARAISRLIRLAGWRRQTVVSVKNTASRAPQPVPQLIGSCQVLGRSLFPRNPARTTILPTRPGSTDAATTPQPPRCRRTLHASTVREPIFWGHRSCRVSCGSCPQPLPRRATRPSSKQRSMMPNRPTPPGLETNSPSLHQSEGRFICYLGRQPGGTKTSISPETLAGGTHESAIRVDTSQ